MYSVFFHMQETGPFPDFAAAFRELHRRVSELCVQSKLTPSTIGTFWIGRTGEKVSTNVLLFDEAKLVAHFLGIMRDGKAVEPSPAVSEEQVAPFFSDSKASHLQYAAIRLQQTMGPVQARFPIWRQAHTSL